jgi:hypothetical protein
MYNTVVGQTGPLVVRRLERYGKLESLVVGPWGEGSAQPGTCTAW